MADASPHSRSENEASRLVVILLWLSLLLPLVFALIIPVSGFFWLMLLLLLILWALLFRTLRRVTVQQPVPLQMVPAEAQPPIVREMMEVRLATEQGGVQIFRGPLLRPADEVFAALKSAFGDAAVPLVQQDEKLGAAIVLVPKPVEIARRQAKTNLWVHWGLFLLTLLTTTWVGAAHSGTNLLQSPSEFMVGLPYSLALLAILGLHELGHYYAARHHGMDVTPPYFIPVPFALGTFGAFIRMRSPAESRRTLFDMAAAGPLAGLVIAVPALYFGLKTSRVVELPPDLSTLMPAGTSIGSSVLLVLIAKLSLGADFALGTVLRLSPMAFAGWLGLFVTALNLLPIGQLDGGHIARSMFGHRIGNLISSLAVWSLILLALFVWPGLMFWVLVVLLLARRGTPPLNDLTPLTRLRLVIGWITFAILALIILPLPASFWRAAAQYCPYL